MKEYGFLREEILKNYDGIRQYECMMYTVVTAILAFSLGMDHYLICLIPYIVIIPVFHLVMSTKKGIVKIATYMIVFLEGEEYNWENLHSEFDQEYTIKKEDFLKWNTHSQYYLLLFICSALTVFKLITNTTYSINYKTVVSGIVVVFTILMFFNIYKNTFDYEETKPGMIEHWEQIKERKEKEKSVNEGLNSLNGSIPTNDTE